MSSTWRDIDRGLNRYEYAVCIQVPQMPELSNSALSALMEAISTESALRNVTRVLETRERTRHLV